MEEKDEALEEEKRKVAEKDEELRKKDEELARLRAQMQSEPQPEPVEEGDPP